MDSQYNRSDSTSNPATEVGPIADAGSVLDARTTTTINDSQVVAPDENTPAQPSTKRFGRKFLPLSKKYVIIGAVVFIGLVGGIAALARSNDPVKQLTADAGDRFATQQVELKDLGLTGDAFTAAAATIQVNGSLIINPSDQPKTATAGQIYFDKNTNQLLYFNGQAFVGVGTGDTITNVTNVTGVAGAATGVRLQTTSPGTQQTGHFNISGVGKVGRLRTSVIDSSGTTIYINPATIDTTPLPGGTPINIGLTSIGSQPTGTGWNNILGASKVVTGPQGGTLQSVSAHYLGGTGSSQLQIGIYEDDGDVPSKPGARLAESALVNLVPNAFTTVTMPGITLSPNTTYWIAANTNDATVTRQHNGGSQIYCAVSESFGFMPDPFSPLGCFQGNNVYSIYATYISSAGISGTASQAHVTVAPSGATLFRNSTDTGSAFTVQNAAGTSTIFNVDTVNGRVAIGKANASHKLDVAGGDINLSNNRSLRFGGLQALSVVSGGAETILSNFYPSGVVATQSENFRVQDASGAQTFLSIDTAPAGDILLTTAPVFGGVTGDITIRSGNSGTTASGNIDIDSGTAIITGTLIGSKDFESGLDNFVDGFGYNDVLAQTTDQAHSGTHSLSITVGLGPLSQPQWKIIDQEQFLGLPVTPGHQVAFSAWVRAGTNSSNITAFADWSSNGFLGGGQVGQVAWANATDVSGGWTQMTGVLTVPAGANFLLLQFDTDPGGSVGDVHYIDDITITDLSSSSAIAAVNLGATNAQQVTLGNAAQIGATTIRGGGINIAGGLGNMNISGGALIQTTSGATYSTTSGALDITAAASSTWRIGNSGGTGGDLTVQSGNAGGNGNGGNLVVQGGAGAGAGTGGNISIVSGDSSTTASGNVTIDAGTGVVSGTLVSTKTFEADTDRMLAWFGSSVAQSGVQPRTGSFSLAATPTGAFWGVIESNNPPLNNPVTPGHQYFYSFWVRAAANTDTINSSITYAGGSGVTNLNTVIDNSTGWTQVSGTGVAPAGATHAFFRISSSDGVAGNDHYFDDFEVIDLSSSTAFAAINIGTINAKIVSVGNANQIGATTIRGGGVDIQAGQGNLTLAGGVFTLTGSAASVLSTSASSLTITSAETATWGVAASTTGVGGDLTINAGNGMAGNNDGGDLFLQGGSGPGTGVGGAVIVRPRENSAMVFQIQDSTGATPLLTADTTGMTISVTGTTTTFAKLTLDNAHFASTQTNPPTIGTPANCGATPSAVVTAASTDTAGSFTITTGTGGTSTTCDTIITFDKTYGAAPKTIIVAGKTDAASAVRQVFVSAENATTFTVSFGTSAGGANSTPYSFSYWVVE